VVLMAEKSERTLILTPLETVKTRKQEFLDSECVVPMGTLTLFAGRGGEGKTALILDYAARVSTGKLPGDYFGRPRMVLIVSHEDDLETQLVPKLQAAGARLENIRQVSIGVKLDDGIKSKNAPSLLKDLAIIRQAIEDTDAALIIFDPLITSIGGDGNKLQDVRRALDPLLGLLHETEIACIGVAHLNKGSGNNAGDRMGGSAGFRDICRSLLLFATDQDSGERICTQDKSSYAANGTGSFKFRLVSKDVPTDDGRSTSVAVVEHLGSSTMSVSDIWAQEREQHTTGRPSAQTWLREYLESVGGSGLQKEIVAAGEPEGYGVRVLQVARERLGLKIAGGGPGNPSRWSLPDVPAKDALHALHAEGIEGASIASIAPIENDGVPL
jgi:hypothetical protein